MNQTKNILITGAAGFIASNFLNYWVKKYPEDKIIALDLLSYASNINSIKSLINKRCIHFYQGNICDHALLDEILENFEINYVINFAAETHVDRSISSPNIFLNTNVLGTYFLLESFKKHWGKNNKPHNWRFLHISTDEVFGSLNLEEKPFNEDSSYKPSSPYSASKASSDHLVRAWHDTYSLPTLITNCSNNYGPFQFPEKLIPLTITNILRGKKIPIYGNGLNIRDWLFVLDHCSAIETVIQKANPGSTYCIGGNNELKNIEVVEQICYLIDDYAPKLNIELHKSKSSELISYVDDRLGHDKRYAINSSKLFNELNWKPETKFAEGLKITVKWYLENIKWWEPLIKINNH
nr:dTDP-glucose 4,6-dehydratase [uncultured Prochlorococcus sp.]